MAVDNNFIDDLKAEVNIVDVIGRDVRLKKAGSNYKGLCPFHNEKTPSFVVSEQKQIFTCFGCGEKGDVIEYVRRRNGCTFMEAVEKLCEDYSITMPESGGRHIDYNKYYSINSLAARFYYDRMTNGTNNGYSYISSRGIGDRTITKFGLGYAPDSWDSLYLFLKENGIAEADMLKLGLIIKGKKGGFYDKFRNRVMFPIFNTQDKVIGFGGRALGDATPKYLNSNESEIFLKKNNLYALNFTKGEIANEDRAIVVEGYMDAISLYQGGVKNVAASLGTALTDNQARLLSRYTKRIVLSYDSDNAGIRAAVRGIDVMRNAGCSVKVLQVTDGKDPDEFIKRKGRDAFLRLVDNAVPATDFQLDVLKKGFDLNDDLQLLEYIKSCVPVLRLLSPVEQDLYIRKLSAEFGISDTAIEREIRTGSREAPQAGERPRGRHSERSRAIGDGELKLELSLLVLSAMNYRYLERIRADKINFRSELCGRIYGIMLGQAESMQPGNTMMDRDLICEALDPDEEAAFRNAADIIKIGPDDEAFYSECKAKILINAYSEKRTELLNELSVAEKLGNTDEVARIAGELMAVNKEIENARRS